MQLENKTVHVEIIDTIFQDGIFIKRKTKALEYCSSYGNWADSCDGFIILYDITNAGSFEQIEHHNERLGYVKDPKRPIVVVVG